MAKKKLRPTTVDRKIGKKINEILNEQGIGNA